MSIDITIKERKEFRCPDCGRLVTTQDVGAECSGGRVWYNFLESVWYYVPYEKRTEENDWYGKDMELTEEQAKQLAQFVSARRISGGYIGKTVFLTREEAEAALALKGGEG